MDTIEVSTALPLTLRELRLLCEALNERAYRLALETDGDGLAEIHALLAVLEDAIGGMLAH